MTGIDIITAIIVLSSLLLGIIRGFVGSLLDIIGIAAGIAVASLTYGGPVTLLRRFDITGTVVELICFLLTSLFFILLFIILIESLRKKVEYKHVLDRIFGVATGALQGIIFAGFLLFIMSSSFNPAMEIQQSNTPKHIVKFFPPLYEKTDNIGIPLPKMVYLPSNYRDEMDRDNEEIRMLRINFSKFSGYTCMECGGKIKFEGYFPRIGATVMPKVACTECGRTSEGCQTYEGFHRLYEKCPVTLAKEKTRFDCGRWPNYKMITPPGPCPVDNTTLGSFQWTPPSTD